MAVKLTPFQTVPRRRRRFSVRIHAMKLEGGAISEVGSSGTTVTVQTRLRCQNKQSLLSPRKEVRQVSSQMVIGKNGGGVEWGVNDDVLENSCNDECQVDLSFVVLRKLEIRKSEKWEEMGRVVGIKIEDLGKRNEIVMTRKLPIRLKNGRGTLSLATFTVIVSITMEGGGSGESSKAGFLNWMTGYVKKKSRETSSTEEDVGASGDSAELTRSASLPSTIETQSSLKRRLGFWKRTSSMLSRRKVEPVVKNMEGGDERPTSSSTAAAAEPAMDSNGNGKWEVKEIVSRDGEAELKCSVALASFDQCSDKVKGEGACSVIVAVVAHWLLMNKGRVPSRTELDRLMVQGAVEWKKLGENMTDRGKFPDNHFDIETVVKAGIRPLRIVQESSVVGFFSPDKFELLKGASCIDVIWKDIESNCGVYVVSWNDHFCVLKVEEEACYLIDSLGRRLTDGCNQAFILRFDDSSVIKKMNPQGEAASKTQENEKEDEKTTQELKDDDDDEKMICRGRECCKEFFKRFLADVLVSDLESKEEMGIVGSSDLHRRLQIEFQYTSIKK